MLTSISFHHCPPPTVKDFRHKDGSRYFLAFQVGQGTPVAFSVTIDTRAELLEWLAAATAAALALPADDLHLTPGDEADEYADPVGAL